ncbi:MAG: hypothetical protein AAB426_11915 [Myxococcota bacterium]
MQRSRERRRRPPATLVLADIPERVRLRELTSHIEARRDGIAELDLEIETLRDELVDFEAHYHARLAAEQAELRRIEGLVSQIERWRELLVKAERPRVAERAHRLDVQRQKQVEHRRRKTKRKRAPPADPAPAPVRTVDERLKQAYRALARRYHPDLARTEEEQRTFGQTMSRINALYRAGDLERLQLLVEQSQGAEINGAELDIGEQLVLLEQRARWFDVVLENLREERAALERSPTCELWRNVEQATAVGQDLIEGIRIDLRQRAEKACTEIRDAVQLLEDEVTRYNRVQTEQKLIVARRGSQELARRFDPFADKQLVRLGLEEAATSRLSPRAREEATWLEASAKDTPALLRLVLLTHVSELSPFPLAGLERYEGIAERFDYLGRHDATPLPLERALVEGDDLVEYGVRQADAAVARLGLRFRSPSMRQAVPRALQALAVRREFKRVLGVLDDRSTCTECQDDVYAVPLYRTRGLDNLRASVCPSCGATLKSYWMPKGQDVQAVLNATFVDYELITEWSFTIAGASVGIQLLPVQAEEMTVGDLKHRLVGDLFERYEIAVAPKQVELWQEGRKRGDSARLTSLDARSFVVRFAEGAPLAEADAVETLRHRVRQKFRAD